MPAITPLCWTVGVFLIIDGIIFYYMLNFYWSSTWGVPNTLWLPIWCDGLDIPEPLFESDLKFYSEFLSEIEPESWIYSFWLESLDDLTFSYLFPIFIISTSYCLRSVPERTFPKGLGGLFNPYFMVWL